MGLELNLHFISLGKIIYICRPPRNSDSLKVLTHRMLSKGNEMMSHVKSYWDLEQDLIVSAIRVSPS